jgi:hypothetical protein
MSIGSFVGKIAAPVGAAVGFAVAGPAGAAAGASLGASVGSAAMGISADAQERKAARQQRRLALLNAMKQRIVYISKAQQAAAVAAVGHVASGAGLGSSMFQGVQSAIGTQVKDTLAFQDLGGDISRKLWNASQQAGGLRTGANILSAVGSLAGAAGGIMPSGGEFVNLPKPGTVAPGGTPVYNPVPPGARET